MTRTTVMPAPGQRASPAPSPPVGSMILGIGTAVPEPVWPQSIVAARLASLWDLRGEALDRWRRIVAGSQIDQRHAVLAAESVLPMSTQQRMEAYAAHAPPLAADAAAAALQAAGVRGADVTDLVVVSCTGFAAPGVDVELVTRLELRADVQRTVIGFMGCFGGIIGVRTADHICRADANAITLVVCVELCSLHLRNDGDPQNLVASALFADGAAAAVIAGRRAARAIARRPDRAVVADHASTPGTVAIGAARTHLLAEGRDWMTWTITDAGFAMTLTRDVPVALRRHLSRLLDGPGAAHRHTVSDCDTTGAPSADGPPPQTLAVHPGGPGILDAVRAAWPHACATDFDIAADVLRRHGNMSSGTILFVLRDLLTCGRPLPALLVAFGPGLSIESLRIEPPVPPGRHDEMIC